MDRTDSLTAYEMAKFRMAERHQEAARARMATGGRSLAGINEKETSVWRRWTFRQLVRRITLASPGT
jgi:hypothetical protein